MVKCISSRKSVKSHSQMKDSNKIVALKLVVETRREEQHDERTSERVWLGNNDNNKKQQATRCYFSITMYRCTWCVDTTIYVWFVATTM
jgi:hypothetical protein